jgi:hypothetical protein
MKRRPPGGANTSLPLAEQFVGRCLDSPTGRACRDRQELDAILDPRGLVTIMTYEAQHWKPVIRGHRQYRPASATPLHSNDLGWVQTVSDRIDF